jgi:hypothetical protein
MKYPLSNARFVCRLLLMLINTTDVFRKTMNFDVLANGRLIKVGVELSGTIASHKTLTLVVGMTMILDDFLRQWMLQNAIILF